ncbi:MAG: hypothetical protein ACM3VS_14960 [Candidatus Dadabacteria bacterium]
MSVDQRFNSLNDKLQQLLRQYSRIQKENERLNQELAIAQSKVSAAHSNIEQLQQQISILKVSYGEMSEKDKKEFEKRINQYIREVDRCIAFLSE